MNGDSSIGNEGNMVKFRAFLDELFSIGIKQADIKQELIKYF